MEEPTNQDILNTIAEHTKNDETFQDETRLVQAHQASANAETEGKLAALEAKLDTLIENTASSNRILTNIAAGEKFVMFGWNNSAKIGGIITFVIGAYLFFKFGLAGLVALIFGKP